jgi:hypothetical protein
LSDNITESTLPDAAIQHLRELRSRLLHLHKILLEMERENFERDSGPVNSGELLQLLINHEQFAWLRMISALVVQIDEVLSAEEPATMNDIQDVISQARSLFTLSADGVFKQKYQAALQREPEVVMAHAEVAKLLRRGGSENSDTSEPDR